MLDMLKKKKATIIKWSIGGFIFSLFAIQVLYWIGRTNTITIYTDFQAGDVLGFLGDYLSFIGAVVLGWIAIMQSDKANDISKRVLSFEEKHYEEDHKPVVVMNSVKLYKEEQADCASFKYDGRTYMLNIDNNKKAYIELEIMSPGGGGVFNCELQHVMWGESKIDNRMQDIMGSKLSRAFNLSSKEFKIAFRLDEADIARFAQKQITVVHFVFTCLNKYNEIYEIDLELTGKVNQMGNWATSGAFDDVFPVRFKSTSILKN